MKASELAQILDDHIEKNNKFNTNISFSSLDEDTKPSKIGNKFQHIITLKGETYIDTIEASHIYGYSKSWFERHRTYKTGPPYIKMGAKVFYNLKKLEEYFIENLIEVSHKENNEN